MLLDLAQFANAQNNAQMNIAGTHGFKNLNTGAESQTRFQDTADGQFSTVGNAVNGGQMMIQGNHQFENFTNNGQASLLPRAFDAQGNPVKLMVLEEVDLEDLAELDLQDLAQFNNYSNMEGGNTQIQGTHAFKNMNNAKGGNVVVLDHKDGQFATFGNTINAGKMQVAGLHQFDNTQNSGQFVVAPRTFNEKGEPVALLDLAAFNQFNNMDGGNAQFTGTHTIKKLNNAEKGTIMFNDHKGGQFSTVGETMNAGKMSISGLHQFDKVQNTGNVAVIPRAFNEKGEPVKQLLLI